MLKFLGNKSNELQLLLGCNFWCDEVPEVNEKLSFRITLPIPKIVESLITSTEAVNQTN